MPTLIFQPQFCSAVQSGAKTQTIRPPRKRPIRVGDPLSLRAWSGKPYRSKQSILAFGVCSAVEEITINDDFADEAEARRDGFKTAAEMRDWFAETHGLPFRGVRVSWR